MALSLVKTASKVAIGGGAVYVTMNQGVWSTTQQGSRALQDIRTSVLPAADKYIQQVPKSRDISKKAVDTWNYGVERAFGGLAQTPQLASEYRKKAVDAVKDNLK